MTAVQPEKRVPRRLRAAGALAARVRPFRVHRLDLRHAFPVASVRHVDPRDAQVAKHDTEERDAVCLREPLIEGRVLVGVGAPAVLGA